MGLFLQSEKPLLVPVCRRTLYWPDLTVPDISGSFLPLPEQLEAALPFPSLSPQHTALYRENGLLLDLKIPVHRHDRHRRQLRGYRIKSVISGNEYLQGHPRGCSCRKSLFYRMVLHRGYSRVQSVPGLHLPRKS